MKRILTALLLTASTAACAASAEPTPLAPREGLWRFTIDYQLVGTPQEFTDYQIEQCLSPSDPVPHIERHAECRHTPHQGLLTEPLLWFVDCSSDEELVHGQGRLHFSGEQAHGNVYIQVLGSINPPQAMIFELEGQYLGECPE